MTSLHKKGMGIVEGVVYVSLVAVFMFLIVNVLSSIIHSYRNFKLTGLIEQSALVSIERITREVRNAKSIDDAGSVFGNSNGVLVLNSTDTSGVPRKVEFSLLDGVVRVKENTIDKGPLSLSSVSVTNLTFYKIDTGKSSAVKFEMEIEATQGEVTKSVNFYDTAVLRDAK